MQISKHAEERIQQRAIPTIALEILQRYGELEYQKGGTYKVALSRRARQQIVRECRDILRTFDRSTDLFAIWGEHGKVITAGRQYRKNKQPSYE